MSTTLVSSDPIALGRRLRRARDRIGFSMSLAARRVGLSRRDLDLLERGRTSSTLEALTMLAQLYDCSVERIITGGASAEPEAVA